MTRNKGPKLVVVVVADAENVPSSMVAVFLVGVGEKQVVRYLRRPRKINRIKYGAHVRDSVVRPCEVVRTKNCRVHQVKLTLTIDDTSWIYSIRLQAMY